MDWLPDPRGIFMYASSIDRSITSTFFASAHSTPAHGPPLRYDGAPRHAAVLPPDTTRVI